MLVYLDTVIVIYPIEGTASNRARASSRLRNLIAARDTAAISDLTRLESRVKPIKLRDPTLLAGFDHFFADPTLLKIPLTSAVYDRAAEIRAVHNFKLGDALHLAAAVESGCDGFLTNDARLARFPGIAVEILA